MSLLVLAAAVVFITADPKRLETAAFWIAFSFAIPLNLAVTSVLHFTFCKKNDKEFLRLPAIYYLIIFFTLTYILIGRYFIYLPIEEYVDIKLLWVLEIITTVLYAIGILYFVFATGYVANSLKETREKVLFIKMLVADLSDCLPKAKSEAVKQKLEKFIDDVRYSDPMSHQSLQGIEQQLSYTAMDLSVKMDKATEEELLAIIEQGEMQLQSRNQRCMMLK